MAGGYSFRRMAIFRTTSPSVKKQQQQLERPIRIGQPPETAEPKTSEQDIIADLRERRAALDAKHAAARTEFEAAQSARQNFMLSGDLDDDAAAAKLQARVDSASSALASLDAAIAELSTRLAEAERNVAAEQNRVAREAAADALGRDIATVEAQNSGMDGRDASPRRRAGKARLGSVRCRRYRAIPAQRRGRNRTRFRRLHSRFAWRVRGDPRRPRQIPHTAPEPPVVRAVTPPPAPTEQIFALRHLSWTDPASKLLMLGQKFTVCELPAATAERALHLKAAISLDDPLCQKLNLCWPHRPRSSADCLDLDGMHRRRAPTSRH